jgi:methylated-DNA-protein-cysteine methyltransferase-like protein
LISSALSDRVKDRRFRVKRRAEKDTYPRIWRTVLRIPRGKVASYGTIAKLSGFPRQGRLAGYALHNLPGGTGIPWHRVINAGGKISLSGKRGEEQGRLLKEEGIVFIRGRISMENFEWRPRRRTGKEK